jgi:hypothetical protein
MKIPQITCGLLLSTTIALHAQKTTTDFNLYLQSKPVGRAKVTLQQSAKGVKLNTRFTYKYLGPAVQEGMKPAVYSKDIADEFLYSPTFVYLDGTSENMETHFRNSFVPSKKRDEIVIQDNTGQSNAGSTFSEAFNIGENLLTLINFDPGAAQCALRAILANPAPDHLYSVFLGSKPNGGGGRSPEGGGGGGRRGGGSPGRPSPSHDDDDAKITLDAKFSPLPDTTGTLDGKSITVKAYQLVSARLTWFFFADVDGNLLETDVLPSHADYIRAGFQRTAQPPAAKE